MERPAEITVLLATRDRAHMLRETLEAFCQLDRTDLDVEFLVVDNGSQDATQSVLTSFTDRLPLRTMIEQRPGKTCAMNLVLAQGSLRDTIVFTDDDVSPRSDWLQEIQASMQRWPDHDVFGGRIRPRWPAGVELPTWIQDDEWVRGVGYAEHDHGPKDRIYPPGVAPLGPSYWLRARALESGIRFDERIGARPRNRTTSEEIDFLERLRAAGNSIVYVPSAEVEHRIEAAVISSRWFLQRAVYYGRGNGRILPLCRPDLLGRSPFLWYSRRVLASLMQFLRLLGGALSFSTRRRVVRSASAITWLTYNVEMIKRAWQGER